MTDYEISKVSRETAKCLKQMLLEDDSLADSLFPPRFMGLKEAAEFCCLPENTIYAKIGQIPHSKIGKRLIFTDRALTRWLTKKDSVSVNMDIKPALRKVM